MPSPMKPSEVLDAAADLLAPEGRWRQRYYAGRDDGADCEPNDPAASCWCVVGSIEHVAGECDLAERAEHFVTAFVGRYPPTWNDAPGRTQEEVVSALRKAADLARSEGQ